MTPEGEPTHTYTIVQQRHQRIERALIGKDGVLSSLEDLSQVGESSGLSDLTSLAGEKLYDVLKVFIPDLMPRWEFRGYGSDEAEARDEYAEHMDRSPSVPQISAAFRAAIDVNGLEFVGKVRDFFGADLIRAQLRAAMATWAAQQREKLKTGPGEQPSLPPENGASAPTSSSPPEPTPDSLGEPVSPSASPTVD